MGVVYEGGRPLVGEGEDVPGGSRQRRYALLDENCSIACESRAGPSIRNFRTTWPSLRAPVDDRCRKNKFEDVRGIPTLQECLELTAENHYAGMKTNRRFLRSFN